MRLKDYLKDKISLLIFFTILMLFIISVVYFDRANRMLNSNIKYLIAVSIVMFSVFLLIDYLLAKGYYEKISNLIEKGDENFINDLPVPSNNQQRIADLLLKKLHIYQNEKIDKIVQDKKDYFEFITAWVHDIKVPIAAARLVMENSEDKSIDDIVYSMEEEFTRIEAYVEKVLYFSKADDFSNDYMIKDINLKEMVNETVKKHAVTFINKRIAIDCGSLDYEVATDKKWVQFIIDQIITNSLKYTNNNGQIRIYAEKDDNETTLHIEDNGMGIRQEDLGRIFKKGFTGYNGRMNQKSTGLGLYLSQKLARKLGHYISLESKYMKYTKATIHFPKWTDYFDVTKM